MTNQDPWQIRTTHELRADRQRRARRLRAFLTFKNEGSWEWMKGAREFKAAEYAAMFDLVEVTAKARLERAFKAGLLERGHDPQYPRRHFYMVPPDAENRLRE